MACLPGFRVASVVFLLFASFPCFAITVSPSSVTVMESGTQQFSASTASTWTTNCGTISSTGLFKAPLYPKVCTVTATATDGSGSSTASASVVSPIVMTPVSAMTPQGQTQQFNASAAVTWTASCGSITSGGLYTASGTVGQYCTIEGIATTSPRYTVYGYDHIGSPTGTTFSISPLNPVVKKGVTQQFAASSAATFSASCGTISAGGLYTAPLVPGSCTVMATSTTGGGSAGTTATITSPISITPASASTAQGQTQQFSANAAVTWSATCGSISTTGLFTASGTAGSKCTIEAIATGTPSYTAFASDTTMAGGFAISPANPTVDEGATQQFAVGSGATWATDCGSISSTGLFHAPLYPKVCTITATATSGSQTATTKPSVVSPIVMTPVSTVTPQGQTQQFTASMPVNWTAACGSITAGGLYTASATVGKYCTIEGIATGTTKYTVYGYDQIGTAGGSVFSISPLNPTLIEGRTQQFTASAAATFAATCGTISSSGFYTAPMTAESCTVTAAATDGSGKTASTGVTVTGSSLAISPANPSVFALGSQQFTANMAVTWSTSCGSISGSSGLFKAPSAAASCKVTATSSITPAVTASTSVAVSVINYTTFQGNNARTGAQIQERVLTPANVNSTSFGLAWSMTLDASIWSQPLYMNAVTVNGAPHNVVYQATANDSIYAIDGDTGVLLWKRSFLSTGVTAVAGSSIHSTINPVGIIGTPAIDPVTLTLYAVAMTAENSNTTFIFRLHAISATTGQEMPNSPVVISAPMFVSTQQTQRPGLLLANGRVYVAFGSISDRLPYHGFLFAFDETTLALDSVFNTDPNTDETGGGGIWMSAMGPAADPEGNIYLTTGNGPTDNMTDFGQSLIKLSPQLDVLDYFTPYNHVSQSAADLDLGSGGVLEVPDQTKGPYTHELITCGKPNSIYVVNREALGGTGTTRDNVIQRVDNQLGQVGNWNDSGLPCFSTPVFWNQNVYFGANHDYLKMFTLDAYTGLLSSTPVSIGPTVYTWPGGYPTISANGNTNGIVWAYEPTSGTLRATNASDLTKEIFVGTVYTGAKWKVPMVVNGHAYIGVQNKIFAFAPK